MLRAAGAEARRTSVDEGIAQEPDASLGLRTPYIEARGVPSHSWEGEMLDLGILTATREGVLCPDETSVLLVFLLAHERDVSAIPSIALVYARLVGVPTLMPRELEPPLQTLYVPR